MEERGKGQASPMKIERDANDHRLWVETFIYESTSSASLEGAALQRNAATLKKLKRDMMNAFNELFPLGLAISSRFLAEQSTGIIRVEPFDETINNNNDDGGRREKEKGVQQQEIEEDVLQLAKAYYNMKEYRRCASVLEKCSSHQATFLRYFSLYLAGNLTHARV